MKASDLIGPNPILQKKKEANPEKIPVSKKKSTNSANESQKSKKSG